MRSLLVLSILVATGCAPSPEPLDTDTLARTWTGSFESDDGCFDSDLRFELEDGGDGWLTGFMTERVHAKTMRTTWGLDERVPLDDLTAIYRVDATLSDDTLTLDLVDLLEGDASFCLSGAELWADDAGSLAGVWDAPDCGCTGSSRIAPEG